jgi:hypothetical protein
LSSYGECSTSAETSRSCQRKESRHVEVVTFGRNVSAPPGYDAVLDYLGLTRINVRKDIGLSDLGLIIIAIKNLNSCIKEVNSEWSYFNYIVEANETEKAATTTTAAAASTAAAAAIAATFATAISDATSDWFVHCRHIFSGLGYKYSLNVVDSNGDTELHLAMKVDSVEAATTLLITSSPAPGTSPARPCCTVRRRLARRLCCGC